MQPTESAAIKPGDYLKNGFFESNGQLRERLNGYFSLGMAYRLRYENIGPDVVKGLLEKLGAFGEANLRGGPSAAGKPLSDANRQAIAALWPSAPKSAALDELKDATVPLMTDWKAFGAAVLHVERIMKQLAMLALAPAKPA